MPTIFGKNLVCLPVLLLCLLFGSIPFLMSMPLRAGEPVFSDDFEQAEALEHGYVINSDSQRGWSVHEGHLVARQVREDHGTVLRRLLDFSDIRFECDFRFRGGTRFNLVFDDSKEKSVHAGHICRVSVTEKAITIRDDKTGVMNQQVRALRKLEQRSPEQEQKLNRMIEGTSATFRVDLADQQWHRLRVDIVGPKMTVGLDGQNVGSLVSSGIDHPTRDKYGFTVTGQSIEFDNWRVWIPDHSQTSTDGKDPSPR